MNHSAVNDINTTVTDDEIGRSQRQHMILRLGLIVCLIFIFMDTGSGSSKIDNRKYQNKEQSMNNIQKPKSQSPYVIRLNEVIINLKRNLNSQTFARNISGTYNGHYTVSRKDVTKQPPGTFLVQLRSIKLNEVPDLDFVYGVAKIYKAGPKESDLLFPLQGVFLPVQGTLHLLSSARATEKLYLQLPAKLNDVGETKVTTRSNKSFTANNIHNKNTTMEKHTINNNNSLNGHMYSHRQSRLLSVLPSMIAAVDTSPVENGLTSIFSYMDDWLKTDEFLAEETIRSINYRQLLSSLHTRLAWKEGAAAQISHTQRDMQQLQKVSSNVSGINSAALPLPSSIRSLSVGSTGMKIHLIDVIPLLSNKSISLIANIRKIPGFGENLMQVIGESVLPVSFKNLQSSMGLDSQVLGTGAGISTTITQPGTVAYDTFKSGNSEGSPFLISQLCQFTMRLNEYPIETKATKEFPYLGKLTGNMNMSNTDERSQNIDSVAAVNAAFATMLFGNMDSTSCGVSFNVSTASLRMQLDEVERKAISYAWLASFVCFMQIALLVLQLRYSQTQAASTKMSIGCISAQSLLDAVLCIAHLVLCAAMPQVFFSHFMWVSILKLLLFGVFEMRTVISIYQSRYTQEIAQGGFDGLRRRLATVHLRFYGALFSSVFLALYFRRFPSVCIIIFYSFWIPQIVYNILSGTRRAFHPLYLVGITITRLFIPLYLLGCPHNFLSVLFEGSTPNNNSSMIQFSPSSCVFLIVWCLTQLTILIFQDVFGPRMFIHSFFPRSYDYYRPVPSSVIRVSNSSNNSGSNNTDSPHSTDIETGGLIECVICYNAVEIVRGTYMITPCDHLFHKECLQRWLQMKYECCICRSVLPALEE